MIYTQLYRTQPRSSSTFPVRWHTFFWSVSGRLPEPRELYAFPYSSAPLRRPPLPSAFVDLVYWDANPEWLARSSGIQFRWKTGKTAPRFFWCAKRKRRGRVVLKGTVEERAIVAWKRGRLGSVSKRLAWRKLRFSTVRANSYSFPSLENCSRILPLTREGEKDARKEERYYDRRVIFERCESDASRCVCVWERNEA